MERSCFVCHDAPLEDCTTCHGGVSNTTGAPPDDLDGGLLTSDHGVGAHTAHMEGESLTGSTVACETCHVVPDHYQADGHLDGDDEAEVQLTGLATAEDAHPVYDHATATCSNTYCHGAFGAGNADNAPDWTGGTGEVACGSCHDMPPPQFPVTRNGITHPPFTECYLCYEDVIDESFTIINKALHINGTVESNFLSLSKEETTRLLGDLGSWEF